MNAAFLQGYLSKEAAPPPGVGPIIDVTPKAPPALPYRGAAGALPYRRAAASPAARRGLWQGAKSLARAGGAKLAGPAGFAVDAALDAVNAAYNWDDYRKNIQGPMKQSANPFVNQWRTTASAFSPISTPAKLYQGYQDLKDQRAHQMQQYEQMNPMLARMSQQEGGAERVQRYLAAADGPGDAADPRQSYFTPGQGMEGSKAHLPIYGHARAGLQAADKGVDAAMDYGGEKLKRFLQPSLDQVNEDLETHKADAEAMGNRMIAEAKAAGNEFYSEKLKQLMPWLIGGGGLMLLAPFFANMLAGRSGGAYGGYTQPNPYPYRGGGQGAMRLPY